MTRTRTGVVALVVLALLAYVGSSQAAGGFSTHTLRGSYGFSGSGTLGGGVFQAAVVGLNWFDGRGGCAISARINAFGTVSPLESSSCTYAVNPDGTGVLDVTFAHPLLGGPFHSDFVIIDGKEVHSMLSDGSGGTVATVVTRRQTP